MLKEGKPEAAFPPTLTTAKGAARARMAAPWMSRAMCKGCRGISAGAASADHRRAAREVDRKTFEDDRRKSVRRAFVTVTVLHHKNLRIVPSTLVSDRLYRSSYLLRSTVSET